MAIYSAGVVTSQPSLARLAHLEVRASASKRAAILEVGFTATASNSTLGCAVGLGRCPIMGVNPTSPVTVLPSNPADQAGTVQVATAWGTPPTVPDKFLRRVHANSASPGIGAVWTFPRGLVLPVSSSVALYALTSAVGLAVAVDAWVFIDE